MEKNITQKKIIEQRLNLFGFITRNEALKLNITRLSAIIHKLKSEGKDIEGEYVKLLNGSKDYKYKLKSNRECLTE